jgi:hypothetical protein
MEKIGGVAQAVGGYAQRSGSKSVSTRVKVWRGWVEEQEGEGRRRFGGRGAV